MAVGVGVGDGVLVTVGVGEIGVDVAVDTAVGRVDGNGVVWAMSAGDEGLDTAVGGNVVGAAQPTSRANRSNSTQKSRIFLCKIITPTF